MLLWNYLVTPAYMKVPREAVEAMLVPVFLPFNFIKCCLNSALTMLLYKPCVNAMRRVGLVPRGEGGVKYSIKPWVIVCSVAVIALMIVLFICLKS